MPAVDEDDPEQRRMLTELRLQATRQIVVLAMASWAIPILVAGLINLERPDNAESPWRWFWAKLGGI